MGIDRPLLAGKGGFAVGLETGGYAVPVDQKSCVVLDAIDGSDLNSQETEEISNPSERPDRDTYAAIEGKFLPAGFTLAHLIGLDQGASAAQVIDNLIESGMGGTPYRTKNGDKCLVGTTTTILKVADGSLYKVGEIIGVNSEYRGINKISANDIYVDPPLSVAPATNDSIADTFFYPLGDTQTSMTIFDLRDLALRRAAGCITKQINIETPGKGVSKLTVAGDAGYVKQIMATKLAEAISSSSSGTATFKVDEIANMLSGFYIDIGTEKGMKITAVNTAAQQITVTRPSGAQPSHAIGDAVTPYWGTTKGNRPACKGKKATMVFNKSGALTTFNFENFSFQIDLGTDLYNEEAGYDGPSSTDQGKRSYTFTVKGLFRRSDFDKLRAAEAGTYFSFIHHTATEDNTRGFVVYIPRARMKTKIEKSGVRLNQSIECKIDIALDADGAEILNGAIALARY